MNQCKQCGKETTNLKFCSLSCSNGYNYYKRNKKLMDIGIEKNIQERIKLYNESPVLCKKCGNAIPYNKRKNIFCSRSCSAKSNNTKRGKKEYNCLNCDKELKRYQGKYCSKDCQWTHIRSQYIEKWLTGKETGMDASDDVSTIVRRYLMDTIGKCEMCGWKEINPSTGNSPLHIHHVDGNYLNSSRDNLQLLCPNCHSITSTYGSLNNGNGRPYYVIKK